MAPYSRCVSARREPIFVVEGLAIPRSCRGSLGPCLCVEKHCFHCTFEWRQRGVSISCWEKVSSRRLGARRYVFSCCDSESIRVVSSSAFNVSSLERNKPVRSVQVDRMKNGQNDTCHTDVRYTCSTEVRRAHRQLHSTNAHKLSKHSAVSQVQSELHQQRNIFWSS